MSYGCPDYSCGDDWSSISDQLCPDLTNGGMDAIILLKCGVFRADLVQNGSTDLLDPDKVQALITANRAKVIPQIQVELTAPSGVTADNYDPCSADAVVNFDRGVSIVDPNVNQVRQEMWDSVSSASGFKNAGMLIHECDASRWTYIDTHVDLAPGRISPAKNNERQRIEIAGTWRRRTAAEIFPEADLVA